MLKSVPMAQHDPSSSGQVYNSFTLVHYINLNTILPFLSKKYTADSV